MRRASTVKLRNAVTRIRRGRKAQGRRYPADLRQQIVAHVVSERSKGVSVRSIAESLGLSYPTLQGWLRAAPNEPDSVYVVHGEARAAATLCTAVRDQLGWCATVPRYRERVLAIPANSN